MSEYTKSKEERARDHFQLYEKLKDSDKETAYKHFAKAVYFATVKQKKQFIESYYK